MAITREDVLHVAALARLEIPEDDVDAVRDQLGAILEAVGKVSELDLSEVAPMTHPLELVNEWAKDEPRPSLSREEALGNAPDPVRRRLPSAGGRRVSPLRFRHPRCSLVTISRDHARAFPRYAHSGWRHGVAPQTAEADMAVIDTLRLTAGGRGRAARARRGLRRRALPAPTSRRSRRATPSCTPTSTSSVSGRRRPDRAQGRDHDEGHSDDRRLQDPRGLHAGLRLDRGRAAARRRACPSSARRTWTSSPWARPRRTRPSARRRTRGTSSACPAAPPAARRRRSRPGSRPGRSAPIPAAPSGSRPRLCGVVGLKPTYGTVSPLRPRRLRLAPSTRSAR